MLKRYAGIALAFLVLTAAGAYASGTSESASTKKTSFTVFFHFTPKEARGVVFREFVKKYNEDHLRSVNVELSYFADWIPL